MDEYIRWYDEEGGGIEEERFFDFFGAGWYYHDPFDPVEIYGPYDTRQECEIALMDHCLGIEESKKDNY